MKRKLFFVVVIVALLSCIGFAQDTNIAPVIEPQTPVSPEDLKKQTDEIREELRKSEAKSAEERRQMEEVRKKQQEEAQKKTDSALSAVKNDLGAKVDTATAKQEEAVLAFRRTINRTVKYGVIAVLLVVAVFAVYMFNRPSKYVQGVATTPPKKETSPETAPGILTNPTIPELEKYSEQHGNVKEIEYLLLLREGQYACTAYLQPKNERGQKMSPLFRIGDNPEKFAWDKQVEIALAHPLLSLPK